MSLEREVRDDGVVVLRLDRPAARNALDRALIRSVLAALAELREMDAVRALVLSTTDVRALCAGADVAEQLTAAEGVERMRLFADLYAAWEAFPMPTVAVCVGNVVGAGAELAAGADLRVAGDNLRLAWAGARLGVPVGVARLVPLVGVARAKELIFTGRTVGMEEAVAVGLAHRAAPAAEAEAVALGLAAEIAAHPVDGLRLLKAMFRDFEGAADRVGRENEILVEWQEGGAGLPHAPR